MENVLPAYISFGNADGSKAKFQKVAQFRREFIF